MSRRLAPTLAALVGGIALFGASASRASEAQQSPVEMVRMMLDVQTQVAAGVAGGQDALQAMLKAMGEEFNKRPADVWSEARNARAAALYLLSGGEPAVARRILDGKKAPAAEAELLRGALAYVEGRVGEARKALDAIDARKLDAPLSAHVAFAQANLAPETETAKARALLELARLLAPGGLIEEAALRREVFLAGEATDAGAFADLSRRYARRFRGSAYFDNFARKFVTVTASFPLQASLPHLPALEEAARNIGAESRGEFYLNLSRQALGAGRNDLGAHAAAEAGKDSGSSRSARARATLYEAAARVGAADQSGALASLQSLDVAALPANDRALHAAAQAGAERAARAPKPAPRALAKEDAKVAPPRPGGGEELVARARKLLNDTAALAGGKLK